MPYYDQTYATAAITAAGVLGTAYISYKLYQSQKSRIPTEWKQVGTLQDLYIYPIKSIGPVIMEKAEITVLGLKHGWLRDRVLMVVDDKNNFITARGYPELLTVHPTVSSSILTIKQADMEPLVVNLAEVIESGKKPVTAHVWGVPVPVYDCGYEASEWFSRFLNRSTNNYRLVYYASHKSRLLREHSSFYKFSKTDTVQYSMIYSWAALKKLCSIFSSKVPQFEDGALPDEVAFNLINEASVEELNTRLKDCQVTHRNFRPNFVLKGAKPYEEDKWNFVKIGDNVFEIIKPCTRCILTTIDPETGVRNSKCEPLETLKTYRQIEEPAERKAAGSTPRMGLQMALRGAGAGLVRRGDRVCAA